MLIVMPKRLDELYECKLCNKSFGNRHSNLLDHFKSLKHKRLSKPDIARQLADTNIEHMELKSEIKYLAIEKMSEVRRLQIEKELELKQKQEELKEQLKEAEEVEREIIITSKEINASLCGNEFINEVKQKPEIKDYNDIFHGITTFQDIFKRDFLEVYETNKVIVIDKAQIGVCYWKNNGGCVTRCTIGEIGCGLKRILTVIVRYFEWLKEYATLNGCNIKEFKLSQEVKKELEEWIKERITFVHF